jgi:hypothetical protein
MSKKILYLPFYPEVYIGCQGKTLHLGSVVIRKYGGDEIYRRSCHASKGNDYLTIDQIMYEISEFEKDLDEATNQEDAV